MMILSRGKKVLNFCANNYLGLSNDQEVKFPFLNLLKIINAAKETMDTHGYGMSSVRFICGT